MIYLDNSATTKQHREVTETMLQCMEETFGNPSSLHRAGLEAERILKKARQQILRAADRPHDRAVFTSGGTEADNLAVFSAVRAGKRQGKRIVTTAVEHPAVMECCAQLESAGYEVVRLGVDRECRLDLAAAEKAIGRDTILVSVMQVNNETGTIMPVEELAGIIRANGSPALLHCDAVQSFGKIPLPQRADLITVSGHKIHGPKGSGALLLRRDLHLQPYLFGGGQEGGLRSGTENVPAIAGFGLAAEMAAADREERMKKVSGLREQMIRELKRRIEGVRINGPEETGTAAGCCCGAVLNVSFPGTRGEVILHTLEQMGICVSTGSACSSNKKGRSHVLQAMGLPAEEIEGAIRFSFSGYNTPAEIEEAAAAAAEAVQRFRKLGSFR